MAFGGENAESYFDEGLTASVKGDIGHAIECFEKAIEYDKSFSSAYHQLGKCQMRIGNPDRAVHLLQKVIENNPHLISARIDLGFALISNGKPEEAAQHFRQILALQPHNAKALFGTANVFFEQGQWESSVTLSKEAVAHGGHNFSLLLLLGKAAKMAGHLDIASDSLDAADSIIEKSIELNPENPEGYFLRGEVYFTKDLYAKALEFYRSSENLAEANRNYSAFGEIFTIIDILIKQAFCYQRLETQDKTRELGRRILEIDPDNNIGLSLIQ